MKNEHLLQKTLLGVRAPQHELPGSHRRRVWAAGTLSLTDLISITSRLLSSYLSLHSETSLSLEIT